LVLNDSNGQDFLEYGRGSLQRDGGFERAYPNSALPLPGGNALVRDLPFGDVGNGYISVAVSGSPMVLTYPSFCNDGCDFYDEAYAVERGVMRRQRAENLGLRNAAPWTAGPQGPTVFDAQCGVPSFPCRAGSRLRARRSDGSSVLVDLEVDSGVLAGRPEWSTLAYDGVASRYVLLGTSVLAGSFVSTTSTAFKVPGQPWSAGDLINDPRRLVAVARPGAAPLAAGTGLYELEGDRWAMRLDAGVAAVCAAWDPTHDRLYVVDTASTLRRWQSDAGLLSPVASNIQCPIAYSPELQQVVVWNHLTGLDGVHATAKGTVTLSAAGARVDGGVRGAQVEVTLGGLGQSDGGAPLPGAAVEVAGLRVETAALPEAPEVVSVVLVAPPDGGAFARTGALALGARSLGVNGAGFAHVRVTAVRAVYELRR
jgi:hypothetical protein